MEKSTSHISFKLRKLVGICFLFLPGMLFSSGKAEISVTENMEVTQWILQNDVLKWELNLTATGSLQITSVYNKKAETEYLTEGGNQLFSMSGFTIPVNTTEVPGEYRHFTFNSLDTGWLLGGYEIQDIALSKAFPDDRIGKSIRISLLKDLIECTLVFEIFDGEAGIRYQPFLKNLLAEAKVVIEKADLLKFRFSPRQHDIHYVTNAKWYSTKAVVDEAPMNNRGNGVAKCLLNLYSSQDGWYMAPEVNWKTQYGPEIPGSLESPTAQGYEYMLRAFAGVSAWSGGSGFVKVATSPEAFQLILFPEEEFEYIAVNFTVFKGDIVDGKMAVEEHLRKRFRFHDTTTSFVVNDWDWFGSGLRTESYYRSVVIPATLKAGYDMVMFDDGWNNPNQSGTGLDNSGLSRDPVEAWSGITDNMEAFTDYITAQGIQFGLWYSMSGGNHNNGNDLASPEIIAEKKEKIEYLINHYNMIHQAVDLTQYWQNMDETTYSHPSDNVYRKNVLTRNLLNELVDKYPGYVVKVTSELDIYPTQGDRNTELLHLPNNGWLTITGVNGTPEVMGTFFGHLPLDALYIGGNPTGYMSDYYMFLGARNVKVALRPDQWDEKGVELMGKFNKWRKSPRIKELTDRIKRPVYMGEKWDSAEASEWNISKGPYIWMHVSPEKDRALLFATTGGRENARVNNFPVRWLDPDKNYFIQDITLDNNGSFIYRSKGVFSGKDLNKTGISINFSENSSPGKAYYICEYIGTEKQVVYVDENITSFTTVLDGNVLKITAYGEPGTEGIAIVYGRAEIFYKVVQIPFDNEGKGIVEVK